MADLQERLRLLRQATGETQAELGRTVGMGQQTIWGWESGRIKPDWRMLATLADHFQVSVDYLIGRTDDPTPPSPAASGPPPLTRWLRDGLLARRVALRTVADATSVPMAVLLEIQEGTARDLSPVHLGELARFFGVDTDEVLAMAPRVNQPEVNADTVRGIAASAAADLTDDERRQVEELILRIRRQRRDGRHGGQGPGKA